MSPQQLGSGVEETTRCYGFQGSEFKVLRFRVEGSGFRVFGFQGSMGLVTVWGFRVYGFRVKDIGSFFCCRRDT